MRKIRIMAGCVALEATLRNTPTADAIHDALPIDSEARTWGKEIYFATPVDAALETDARDVVSAGEIAYWREGKAIAIGFGETPISAPGEIRLASPTNVFADAHTGVSVLDEVRDGDPVRVERI